MYMKNFPRLLCEIHVSTHSPLGKCSVKSVTTEAPISFRVNDVPYAVISFCEKQRMKHKGCFLPTISPINSLVFLIN